MKNGSTEMVFILDRSGSMGGLESDTIGGFNTMLGKQKAVEGDCRVTTVLFDNDYELLHDRIEIQAINPITEKEYFVRGSTALIDAIGRSIDKIVNVMRHTGDDYKSEKVILVIITDGMENASREYTADKVKKMIEYQKQNYNWEFIFLGANIDAVETAAQFGIDASRAQNYHADSQGVAQNFYSLGNVVSSYRTANEISDDWKDDIDKDFKNRKKKK